MARFSIVSSARMRSDKGEWDHFISPFTEACAG